MRKNVKDLIIAILFRFIMFTFYMTNHVQNTCTRYNYLSFTYYCCSNRVLQRIIFVERTFFPVGRVTIFEKLTLLFSWGIFSESDYFNTLIDFENICHFYKNHMKILQILMAACNRTIIQLQNEP